MGSESGLPQLKRRSSAFTETGLEGHDAILDDKIRGLPQPLPKHTEDEFAIAIGLATPENPPPPNVTQTFPWSQMSLSRFLLLVAIVALATFFGPDSSSNMMPAMAEAGPVVQNREPVKEIARKRQSTSVAVCKRWSGQSALVNGTIYYYGGRATTSASQTTDQWNNDFVALNLSKSWQISSPSLTGLASPSGPPPVSLGSLWSSTDNLYLYGGQFSDSPVTEPVPFSLWSYEISSSSWQEHQNPKFGDGSPVQRAAEGAGISVPGLGLGYYFGGHLDGYTTSGWSQSIARVYLPSMLEFTMPGFSTAGSDGSYRNITVGSAGSAGFPERADGVLVYVPGYSKSGIIVGLAGGTNQTYTQLNILDVYDIETSTWYKQATEGPTPDVRVNPCAVAATSADGTSVQIYMYGGQNLIPYGSQTQYDDMWILTIPSFTWIQVDTSKQSVPPARAGHTCNIWNGQMVVIGGYVGQELSCDTPGIYVFNTSSLEWQSKYTALAGGDDLNRQTSQKDDPNALQGSYGYQVPEAVISVVGGNAVGSATVTAPAQTPMNGPLATGAPATYTITGSDGSVVTQTSVPGSSSNNGSEIGGGSEGPNIGAIVAGVIAGLLFLVALYLGFCTFIYRKQLALYKNHVSMAQRDALTSEINRFGPGLVGVASRGKSTPSENTTGSSGDRFSSDNRSGNTGGTNVPRRNDLSSNNPYNRVPGGAGYATAASSTDDLLMGQEPSFLGVMLNPRRSLRVVNKD